MKRKRIGDLSLFDSGHSRGRILLITLDDDPADPLQLNSTRWIVFGQAAANTLRALLLDHTYHQLAALLPGGISSSTWQDMRRDWQLHPPQTAAHGDLEFLNFGRHNNRVLLLRSGPSFLPERLDDTSLIALSPRARRRFADFLATLPAATSDAHAAAARIVPGGLAGKPLIRARQLLRHT